MAAEIANVLDGEAFFLTHPKVAQAAVFGVPDPKYGEQVAAWIQLHHGETSTPEELQEFAKGRVAHFKVPYYVRVVEEFPMTVTGKIQKFRMREIAAEWIAAENDERVAVSAGSER